VLCPNSLSRLGLLLIPWHKISFTLCLKAHFDHILHVFHVYALQMHNSPKPMEIISLKALFLGLVLFLMNFIQMLVV
jgi:hypothetical protein